MELIGGRKPGIDANLSGHGHPELLLDEGARPANSHRYMFDVIVPTLQRPHLIQSLAFCFPGYMQFRDGGSLFQAGWKLVSRGEVNESLRRVSQRDANVCRAAQRKTAELALDFK